MPHDWSAAKAPDGRVYYFLPGTDKTTWDRPENFVEWRPYEHEGKTYYYNVITKETSAQPPASAQNDQPDAFSNGHTFVAGGFSRDRERGGDMNGQRDRRESRFGRDSGLPQKPSGGGMLWEGRPDGGGFRGAMAKSDQPDYATYEQAEEAFFKVLRKHNIGPQVQWEDALREVVRERDYRAVKDPKDRKAAFYKYCEQVRKEELAIEIERRAKQKEEFRKMLATHEEINHCTRWKTARPIIEREAVFKGVGNDKERQEMFYGYIGELQDKHNKEMADQHWSAVKDLEAILKALVIDSNTSFATARQALESNERFVSEKKFRTVSKYDLIRAFEHHIQKLDVATNDAKQKERRLRTRRERKARDEFRQLLKRMRANGKIEPGSQWQTFHPLIAEESAYLDLIGLPGSSPLDLFWDVVEEEERIFRAKRNDAMDVLEDRRYEMTTETSLQEFSDLMGSNQRTSGFSETEMEMIYGRLMEKIKKREEDDRLVHERTKRKAIDVLRGAMRRVEPPIGLNESYDDVLERLQSLVEFRALRDEGARKVAFEKYIRRLKEKDEDVERERARRERDREHRLNGSARGYDRDPDRRRRTRTPEVDAYEADRRKAQADRERQYRKASFPVSPPPRDRDDRYRPYDRAGGPSMYDRERRDRETERERLYISRADPRDRGVALHYGDEDVIGSRPGSARKRKGSDGSTAGKRENKVRRCGCNTLRPFPHRDANVTSLQRSRRGTRTPERHPSLELELRSGSEEGEIEEH